MKESHHVRFLPLLDFGLFAGQTPFGFGDLHPLPEGATVDRGDV
jgi:hypothetical protein